MTRDHSQCEGTQERGIVRFSRLMQSLVDGQSFIGSPEADIAQQGVPKKLLRRCPVRWKTLIERDDCWIITGLEERRGF
jgi:hypothetical protein